MKHCRECGTDKPEDQFHKRAASVDGLSAKCKSCQSEYDKARANDPKRVKAREEYQKTEKGIEAGKRAKRSWANKNKGKVLEVTQRYRASNPNKAKAHGMVSYAVKCGNLHKEPCEICGSSEAVHAHHDDYAKPLNVRWLCAVHHKQWHAKHGEAANP
jgi:hypothetical protein